MTPDQKISIVDNMLTLLKRELTHEDVPVVTGNLNKKIGMKAFREAEVGHLVFEYKDRYLIYLESIFPDKISVHGKLTEYKDFVVCVPYYKETLAPFIDLITPI